MRTAASIHRRERLPSYGGFAHSTRTSARGSSCRVASAWACGALRSPLCRRHPASSSRRTAACSGAAPAGRARLGRSDRAFAQQLTYGTVQRRLTLDYVIAAVSARPLAEIDPPVLDALRLGVYQLLWMGSVPDHAAVDETVELAKSAGGSG